MKIIGYIILNKTDAPMRHAVRSNIDYFPYIIFPTLEEALEYNPSYDTQIRKVSIVVNKTHLEV